MDWHLPREERTHLRDLARRKADIAALPIMDRRKAMWYALNDGQAGDGPPVIVETWTFDRDFLPEPVFRCLTDIGRGIETNLLRDIRNHEFIDDDKVICSTYDTGFVLRVDEFGVQVPRRMVEDCQGVATGYQFDHPIKDLRRDFHVLKPSAYQVDRQATQEKLAFLEDLLGDILAVTVRCGLPGARSLTQRAIVLMGMEAFYTAMFDCPDEVHRLMAYLRDNALNGMRWGEAEGLLRLNNGNQNNSSSYNFTTALPAAGYSGPAARLCDLWGESDSQETVGISPGMFHEFCWPYYRDVCEPLGLLYFGCCEPANPFWDDISRLPHLKKISISKWADEEFMGDRLRGTSIVYSRKPDPNLLGVTPALDEEAWAAHIRKTLAAARGAFLEFIVRDVYTVHGDLGKVRRAVEIARREIDVHC